MRGVVDQELGGEVVGAVDDHVGARHELGARARRRNGVRRRHGADVRVVGREPCGRDLRLGPADVRDAVERLAMQVRGLDAVVVDDRELADARAGEAREDGAAEPAGADHDDARRGEARLARRADLGQGAAAANSRSARPRRVHAACSQFTQPLSPSA